MPGLQTSRRTAGDLAEIFEQGDAADASVVYETFGCVGDDSSEPPRLLYATTVLYPGEVGGECFMTRGHFHTRPDRGEVCLTLAGKGLMLLADRLGNFRYERMTPGSIVDIPGTEAHRAVNVGTEPLAFYVCWMSDCGHDYESVRQGGFPRRIFRRSGSLFTVGPTGLESIDEF